MRILRFCIVFFSLLLSSYYKYACADPGTLARQYISKYEALEQYNKKNELAGRPDLNNYIIVINAKTDTVNWMTVKLKQNSYIETYTDVRNTLVEFNSSRKDSLRFYVVIIDGFKGSLKEDLKLDDMPSTNASILKYINIDANFTKFQENSNSLSASISNDLVKYHYKNNIIYFCKIMDVCKKKECRSFLIDDILIKGPALTQKQASITSRAHSAWVKEEHSYEPADIRIKKAVHSIIYAVRIVIDAGIENDKDLADPACTISLDGTVAQTKEKKLTSFSPAALSVVAMLESSTSFQSLDSRYLLVDSLKNFPGNDIFFRHILPDKLNMMADGFSNFEMYVIFKEISFAMMPSDWRTFAQEVYEKSNFAKQTSNILLVTVPYYKGSCKFTNIMGQKLGKNGMLLFPGAYCPGNNSLTFEMNAALSARATFAAIPNNPFEMSFNEAFKRIPKKYIVYKYEFQYNGGIIGEGLPAEFPSVVGFEDLVDIQLLIDQRFEEYKSLLQQVSLLHTLIITAQKDTDLNKQRRNELQNKTRDIIAIETSPSIYKAVGKTNLIQSQLNSEIVSKYVRWYSHRKYYGIWVSLFGATEGEYFYGGENHVRNKDILEMIDMASLATAIVGLDVVFDGIGAYYAYEHGMYEEVAIYALAATIPLVCSPVLRKAIKESKIYVTRTVKGTYIALPRALAMGAGFTVEGMSSFLRRVLGDESFEMVAKYKTEARFLESLEEAMVKDEKIISQFNKIPGLADEYHAFHSAGKGDVVTFLEKRLDVKSVNGRFQVIVNGVSVGGGELHPDGFIRLIIDVFKGPNKSRLAFGDEVFEKIHTAIAKEAEKDGRSIKGVAGTWASFDPELIDNLNQLNEAILKEVKTGKMTLEQAALNKTFTGGMAKDKGYIEVYVAGLPDPEDGTYNFVNVYFSNDPEVIKKIKAGL